MLTTSEWQGLNREVGSEGSRTAKLRADEQKHHMRRRLKASLHQKTKPCDLTATVNDAVAQGKFMFLSGEICSSGGRSITSQVLVYKYLGSLASSTKESE